MAHDYLFITSWLIEAPLPDVWQAIYRVEHWPDWWPGVESVVEIETGNADGIGALHRYTWKSALSYRLTFDMRVTRIEPMVALEGRASGELAGVGRWLFSSQENVSRVRYEWHVTTRKTWMNLLAPVAHPIFKWNHDIVMRRGGHGLARRLGARLLGIRHHELPAPPSE